MRETRFKDEMLKDEFNVQVFTSGRIVWDRLDLFLKQNQQIRRRLEGFLVRPGVSRGRSPA